MQELTAKNFIEQLEKLKAESELKKYSRFFKLDKNGKSATGDQFIGVRMGDIFKLAKEFIDMPIDEIEKLLASPIHEVRVGAVSIMDYKARDKKATDEDKKELFNLYVYNHEGINTWDLVDRSAIYVVGQYLANRSKEILYKLARSGVMAERRTAIVSTAYFMMQQKETEETFKIAEMLINDSEDLIHKAVGWMLRVAGDVDKKKLLEFLDIHASTMPRVMLRYAIEKFDKKEREKYMKK